MTTTAGAAGAVREFHYRVGSLVRGHFPGHHRSARGDGGFEFRGHAFLHDMPDARRLDLRASLRDPFSRWIVRRHSQRQSIPVVMVADLSASMAFSGARDRRQVMADFAESLAWSAWRTGDSFGFIGCDDRVRPDWFLPATRARGMGGDLAARLRAWQPGGRTAAGLAHAHELLGRQRALVFLVSDFHLPLPEAEAVLQSLAGHDVVPVVLWDDHEFDLGPGHGLAPVVDPETGQRRLVWWRPSLRDRWARWQAQRRAALCLLFEAERLRPLFIDGAFDADAVTRHFHA